MCTALSITDEDFYFGRNLDLDYNFGEQVVFTPRNAECRFKNGKVVDKHRAFIGMATVFNGVPLYADAMNESGLAAAGLNFPGNAYFGEEKEGSLNIAAYELITWIMCNYDSVKEVKKDFKNLNMPNIPFAEGVNPGELHYIVSDSTSSIVIEPVKEGVKIYDNPLGVLTNNPPFPEQIANYKKNEGLSPRNPEKNMIGEGFGALGLPGDMTPASRFRKIAFLKENYIKGENEEERVIQFFHILDGVKFIKGSVITESGKLDKTIYSCCINGRTGDYYYKTYENPTITKVSVRSDDLNGTKIKVHPLNRFPAFMEGNFEY